MADTLQFDLVSPERRLASVAATRVQIPGIEGSFTALPDHAPFLTTLRPGVVAVDAGGTVSEFVVTGGFAEVTPAATAVLAERALPRDEVTPDFIATLEAEAQKARDEAPQESRMGADQRLRDVQALKAQLGR